MNATACPRQTATHLAAPSPAVTPADSASAAASASQSTGTPTWLWAVIAAASVLAAGAVLFPRRRHAAP